MYEQGINKLAVQINSIGIHFVRWLIDMAKKNGDEAIFFNSRDGFWFFRLYDDLPISLERPTGMYYFTSRESIGRLVTSLRDSEKKSDNYFYLRDCFSGYNSVAIVDLGWRGTYLTQIRELFPEVRFRGYFLGNHKLESTEIWSYLGRFKLLKLLGGSEILETMFSAPHPSVIEVSGTFKEPKCKYQKPNVKLESLQKDLENYFRLNISKIVQKRIFGRLRIKFYLYKICLIPDSDIFKILRNIEHSVKGNEGEGQILALDSFPEPYGRALVPFWSIRAILIAEGVGIREKSIKLKKFVKSQYNFYLRSIGVRLTRIFNKSTFRFIA